MAIIGNTFQTYQAKGIRESLSNIISNIAPEETPFQSNAGKESVRNTLYEWQTDDLSAVDTGNAHVEGDDISVFDAVTPTVRLQNYTQILRKTVVIADTTEATDRAGRKSELAYQLAKKGAELKRDWEAILLSNQAASAGTTSTPRNTASVLAFIKTNTDFDGVAGADPVYTTLPNAGRTDGTQRAFTEAQLKNVISKIWTEGGKLDMLMVGSFNKQAASAFTGIADQRYMAPSNKPTTIIGAADVYLSDFGTLNIVPNRFMRQRDALLIDTNYVSIATLRPIQQKLLAKTGDAEKRMLVVEAGLKVLNEKALGGVFDLTTA